MLDHLSLSRRSVEDQIERLIDLLDSMDPDPDLEENGDLEPSISTCFRGVVDAELDTADNEPSLGSLDGHTHQGMWGCGSSDDAEKDHSDLEDGGDDELTGDEGEPWLGSRDALIDQTGWASGNDQDLELDPTEYRGRLPYATDADVVAAHEASRRVREIAGRKPGLAAKRPKRRPANSICNIGPMVPIVIIGSSP